VLTGDAIASNLCSGDRRGALALRVASGRDCVAVVATQHTITETGASCNLMIQYRLHATTQRRRPERRRRHRVSPGVVW